MRKITAKCRNMAIIEHVKCHNSVNLKNSYLKFCTHIHRHLPFMQRLCERQKQQFFTNARKNASLIFHQGTRNPSLEDMERLTIFRLRRAVCSEIQRKRPNRPGCRQPALARDGDKVDFACTPVGRGASAAVTQRARVKYVVLDKPSDARLRNQASVTEQDVRKRLRCD